MPGSATKVKSTSMHGKPPIDIEKEIRILEGCEIDWTYRQIAVYADVSRATVYNTLAKYELTPRTGATRARIHEILQKLELQRKTNKELKRTAAPLRK